MPEVEMLSSGDAAAEGVFSGGVTQPAGADAGPRQAGWSDCWPFLSSSMKSGL